MTRGAARRFDAKFDRAWGYVGGRPITRTYCASNSRASVKVADCRTIPAVFGRSRSSDRRRIALRKVASLMPIGISGGSRARFVQALDLVFCQVPADRSEILSQLFFVAGADDDGRNGRPVQEPVERD